MVNQRDPICALIRASLCAFFVVRDQYRGAKMTTTR